MRLWHQKLIPKLPRLQLLGQHRECCALRGNGWGKKHSVVDYVFNYSQYRLFLYHKLIMSEMILRGYKVNNMWYNYTYRGKELGYRDISLESMKVHYLNPIYPEHNDEYLKECLDNLKEKGIIIEV